MENIITNPPRQTAGVSVESSWEPGKGSYILLYRIVLPNFQLSSINFTARFL